MLRYCFCISLFSFWVHCAAQTGITPLTVEKIMRDPRWVGTSPTEVSWGADGKALYFKWNPENQPSDSLYKWMVLSRQLQRVTPAEEAELVFAGKLEYTNAGNGAVYSKNGDIFFKNVKTGKVVRVTNTVEPETNPVFSNADKWVVYRLNNNLFAWDIQTGTTRQLTNFVTGAAPALSGKNKNNQERWLAEDQLRWLQVVRERDAKRTESQLKRGHLSPAQKLKAIYIDGNEIGALSISADGRWVAYQLNNRQTLKGTLIPDYVNETGFTTTIPGRPKVGVIRQPGSWRLYDRLKDTVLVIYTDSLPGRRTVPAFFKDYPAVYDEKETRQEIRAVAITSLKWSPAGGAAICDIESLDNKDRWLAKLDLSSGYLQSLDHQHDEAWIGGPGITATSTGWIDGKNFWYQSERTGFSHLYRLNVETGEKKTLTAGNWEVQQVKLSADHHFFYISSNQQHPGEQQFYRVPATGGKIERITNMTGANQVFLSPDEKKIAILYSYSNKPWELFLQDNKPGAKAAQITFKAMSTDFQSYAWRDPELVKIKASDGATVFARLYKPRQEHATKPAVIFVHGAGYLQNAHKWWSSYFREYMFHNLLSDNGYYVLDMDYRASAGYGRDWRTAIYRHMGGRDLQDQLDGARWLVDSMGVDSKRIGIYGGSYGGFITLMALFTAPGIFAAGAALRPVTDWAHYNHGYTSNILNTPVEDSIAYRRSSPIYFAEGLQDHLLICHGLVDVNVHVQDVMRLNQRLIELGKSNWTLALYPMEDHAFVEPSSCTDEYTRIFALFETILKK